MKKSSKISALALASLMLLSACGKKADSTKTGDADKGKTKSKVEITPVVENEGTPVKDATLKVAIIGESTFKGVFHELFAQDNFDMNIMQKTIIGFFDSDPDFKSADTGAGSLEFKPEEKKAIIKIKDAAKWSDGVPVTAKDFLRYYLVVGHKDYEGVRYGTDYKNVVGMEEYHEGKAEDISGVKIINDKELEVTFKEFDHSIYWNKGIPFNPIPDHIYKDIPIKEQEAHDATRKNPLGFGPYVIKEIVPGQQVVAEANPYYFGGEPKVKRLEIKMIPSSQVVAAAKSGEFDIVEAFGSDLLPKLKELTNGKVATQYAGQYSYIGFKLGKMDKEKGEVVTDPNAKMNDKELRKAMAKAIDKDTINEKLLFNLSVPVYQVIPPIFKTIYDENFEGHRFNKDEAKKLLDAAGYKDTNNDGIREDKNGQPLKINFAAMTGGATQEPTVQFLIQSWKEIGLDVQLVSGRLIEFNSFYEKIMADDPEVDMYMAGWNTGTNPDPTGFYGKHEEFNMVRFTSPELDTALKNLVTLDNTDAKVRLQHYIDFNKYFVTDQAVVIPMFSVTDKAFVNNRVKKWSLELPEAGKAPFRLSDVELTKDAPEVGK